MDAFHGAYDFGLAMGGKSRAGPPTKADAPAALRAFFWVGTTSVVAKEKDWIKFPT
jgi:hypothetical protein